jgi:hypothetical protein
MVMCSLPCKIVQAGDGAKMTRMIQHLFATPPVLSTPQSQRSHGRCARLHPLKDPGLSDLLPISNQISTGGFFAASSASEFCQLVVLYAVRFV